ncbi:MAG: lysylphosphatidylglycerol synthase domain-containing protein [Lutibacter sp.]|nr:lysylphosphatidylglycerol synthase domain-containing protein [Lutibacter sp.]
MYNNLNKYKHLLFTLIKFAIVLIAILFIYQKLAQNPTASLSQLKEQLVLAFGTNLWYLLFILLLTDFNLIFEFLKWQKLVAVIKKITFLESYEQCLASLTASIITPNRIGEYGVKAIYFSKNERKKILFLNLIGNLMQMFVTVLFGIIGMRYFRNYFDTSIPFLNYELWLYLAIFLFVLFLFRKKIGLIKIGRFYIDKIALFIKKIDSKTIYTIFGYSLLRYIIFSHQFYFLLLLFNVEASYFTLIFLIFCMYFLASIIPSIALFDWAIKGSVALYVFSFSSVSELTIIFVTTLMWILNVAIPALIGSVFVLNFKLNKEV